MSSWNCEANPSGAPFILPAEASGSRRLPPRPGFSIWCEEILVNKNVVSRFEIGDQIVMSTEMIARLKSLGYLDEGEIVRGKKEKPRKGASPADDLLKDQKVIYMCKPLEL